METKSQANLSYRTNDLFQCVDMGRRKGDSLAVTWIYNATQRLVLEVGSLVGDTVESQLDH